MRYIFACLLFLINFSASAAELSIPESAQVGQPIIISTKTGGVLEYMPKSTKDTFLSLNDRNGNPVDIFWSSEPRLITFAYAWPDSNSGLKIEMAQMLYGSDPGPGPQPAAVRELILPAPTVDISVLNGYKKHKELAYFYYDIAQMVKRTQFDTATFRSAYMRAGQICFAEKKIQDPKLAEAIDSILVRELGTDVGPLDADKAFNALMSIAWYHYND